MEKGIRDKTLLLNTSIGGAYLKGYQHLPMSEVEQHLKLSTIDKTGLIEKALSKSKQWPDVKVQQQLNQTLEALIGDIQACIKDAKTALSVLQDKLLARTPDKWQQPSERYSEAFNRFSERLEGSAFLHDTYYHEQLALRHHYVQNPTGLDEIKANFKLDESYLKLMLHFLKNNLLPNLLSAKKELIDRNKCLQL